MNFSLLVQSIQQTHGALQAQAVKAINRSLTLRNWLIGFYIVEFEQKGEDRAAYGEQLLKVLAREVGIKGLSFTNLKLNRQFYLAYPQIGQTLSDIFKSTLAIGQTVSDQLQLSDFEASIWQTVSAKSDLSGKQEGLIVQTASEQLQVSPEKILNQLSFSHITELLPITDPLKKAFYEIECIRGTWSVRELKRQINSLYYERSGLSGKPDKLRELVSGKTESLQPADIIKSVYTFEFLGLSAKEAVEESDLETALLDHLQQLMLELGRGYCLEARQQKILIGGEYYFIDLVFYHRILKCHVLIDLKVEAFDHANAGQLNAYLNYYKKEVMEPGDNPPVGILLVTNKNDALVEYATAGMDNQLFVSKYLVELPSKIQLENWVKAELKSL
jgi:predicted nuclease of restriction endonuclease-like (RecB) superfamily